MSELGKAYVQIVPSAKGISGSISKELNGESVSAGKSAGLSIANAIKGSIIAAGIGTVIKSALEAGGNLQQSFGGLETLYGEAAEGAKKYAAEAAKAGISANTYAEQAVSFGASLKQAFGGDTQKAMESANVAILDMADNAAKMGTPIEQIQTAYAGFSKGQYQLLDNLKLGYGGTKTEMERLLADAQKLTGVEYNIDNLGDVYDAIHVIQEDLGLTGVAAAEASETFSGSLGAMKAAGENLLANLSLGEDVTPSLNALVESIKAFALNNLLPMIVNMLGSVPDLIAGITSAIIEAIPQLIDSGLQLFEKFKESLPTSDMLDKGLEIVTNLINGIIEELPQFIETAGKLITDFATYIMNNLPTIMQKGAELLLSLVNGIVKNLPQIVTSVVKVIAQFIATIGKNLPKILEQGYKILGELIAGLIKAIPDLVKSIPKIISSMVDTFKGYDWLEIGVNILQGIIDGMMGAISSIVEAAREAASAIYDGIKDFFSINSPSKKTMWIGKMIDSGLAEGISDNQDLIDDALDDINTDLASQLQVSANVGAYDNRQASGGIVVNMTINGAAGQDVEQLADYVQQKLMNALGRNEAVYA